MFWIIHVMDLAHGSPFASWAEQVKIALWTNRGIVNLTIWDKIIMGQDVKQKIPLIIWYISTRIYGEEGVQFSQGVTNGSSNIDRSIS